MASRKTKGKDLENLQENKPINLGVVGYIGGHSSYRKRKDAGINVYFYDDRIEINFLRSNSFINVPYSSIINIENTSKKNFNP